MRQLLAALHVGSPHHLCSVAWSQLSKAANVWSRSSHFRQGILLPTCNQFLSPPGQCQLFLSIAREFVDSDERHKIGFCVRISLTTHAGKSDQASPVQVVRRTWIRQTNLRGPACGRPCAAHRCEHCCQYSTVAAPRSSSATTCCLSQLRAQHDCSNATAEATSVAFHGIAALDIYHANTSARSMCGQSVNLNS